MARLEAADVYAQHITEERLKEHTDTETVRRLREDAAVARKSAEVLALVRLGDVLESVLLGMSKR